MFDIATEFCHHLRDFRGIRLFVVKILWSSCNVFCFVQRLTHFALMGKFCKSNLKKCTKKKEAVYASFFCLSSIHIGVRCRCRCRRFGDVAHNGFRSEQCSRNACGVLQSRTGNLCGVEYSLCNHVAVGAR